MKKFFISIKRWFLLVLLLTIFCTFFYFNLHHYLTFDTLKTYHAAAEEWTLHHYSAAVSLYLFIFSVLIACGIPCATLLTLLGGFLFGSIAVLYAILGITLGGVLLFYAIRTAIGIRMVPQSKGWIKMMEKGFRENAFSYLLMLRLIPIMPCWIINISAGLLNVPIKTFIIATVLGIFPATFVYVMFGRGLGKFFAVETPPNLNILLTPEVCLPLLGLAILSLFPVFYKLIKKAP